MILATDIPAVAIFFIILGAAGIIAIVAFAIYRILKPKLKVDDKPSEEQLVQEEMDRLLKPIEDEKTAKAVSEYKDEEE